jgi:hypothetical protein
MKVNISLFPSDYLAVFGHEKGRIFAVFLLDVLNRDLLWGSCLSILLISGCSLACSIEGDGTQYVKSV